MSYTTKLPPPFPAGRMPEVDRLLRTSVANSGLKIVVLDDDPTGVQTVHHVSVYTNWSVESLCAGMLENRPLFFVLTNSRAMTEAQTVKAHREIARNLVAAARETGRAFLLVSRGDSTLRGHYPLETQVLREELEALYGRPVNGEIVCPYFREGGRFTIENVHYVQTGDTLVPAADTEFAKDQTFGYTHSDLREYIEEKTRGAYPAAKVEAVTLTQLRALDLNGITEKLLGLRHFQKLVVNAADDYDVKVFCVALYQALSAGGIFCCRTAASFVKAVADIADQPLLGYAEMISKPCSRGGIVMVGSHTQKTTEQLTKLLMLPQTAAVELNSDLVLQPGALEAETVRIAKLCSVLIAAGKTPVVFTRRVLLTLDGDTPEAALTRSVRISDAVQAVVAKLGETPSFIVAKGGITSSDIATKALRVRRADVLGQLIPGVPVWKTGPESHFPGIPYVIFPGNVGREDALLNAVQTLTNHSNKEGAL